MSLPTPHEDPCAWVILLLVALLALYLVIAIPVTVYAPLPVVGGAP